MKDSVAALLLALALSFPAHAASHSDQTGHVAQPGVPLTAEEMSEVTAGSFDLSTMLMAFNGQEPFDYTYTNPDPSGGSISFNGIRISGLFGATMSVVDAESFKHTLASLGIGSSAGFYHGGDVVQIAVPTQLAVADPSKLLSISIGSIKMGNSPASFGSLAVNQIDLRGTSIWTWRH